MELTLEYIFEENKLGSNRFLDALKKGNKDNLDLYFNFAKQHKINLFDYTTQTNKYNPLDSIVKYLNKELINKNNEECNIFMNEWFHYLKVNGYSILQEKLINYNNSNIKYVGYLNNYRSYNKFFSHVKNSIKQNINISDFILQFTENDSLKKGTKIHQFINNIDEQFFSNNFISAFIIKMNLKNIFNKSNIFKIDSYKLLRLEEEKILNISNEIIKELQKPILNNETKEHIFYILNNDDTGKVLSDLLTLDKNIFSVLNELIFPESLFNNNKNKNRESSYIIENQYRFYRYLNNIMFYNSTQTNNKFKFNGYFTNSLNYLKLVSHFSELPDTFLKYNKKQKNFKIFKKEMLNDLGIKYDNDLFKSLFKTIKQGDLSVNMNTFCYNEFNYLIKNWIPVSDIVNNFEWLKSTYINKHFKDSNSFSYDTYSVEHNKIDKKILSILEVLPNNFSSDFLNDLTLSKKTNFLLSSDILLNKYFDNHNFNINNFINVDRSDYELDKNDLKTIIKHYLVITKKMSLTDIIEINLDDFVNLNYKDKTFVPNNNLFQKFFLDLELSDSTLSIKNKMKNRL